MSTADSHLNPASGTPSGDDLALSFKTLQPFVYVGLFWLALGIGVCVYFATPEQSAFRAIQWFLLLWGFCLFDLYALARAVGAALQLVSTTGEKRGALIIHTSYWGLIKLACLGILGAILWRGSSIPTSGLLMGSATLIVTPLLGGYWWSQKVLRHAS